MTNEARGETLLEEGVVLAVTPATEAAPGKATVRLVAGDHCDGCPASSVCKPSSGEQRLMDVNDPVGVDVGDRVQVAVPGGAVLKMSFLVYGLPLLLLLAGVWLGTRIWSPETPLRDLWSFLLGAGLAALAVPFVQQTVRRTEAAGGQVLAARIEARIGVMLEATE